MATYNDMVTLIKSFTEDNDTEFDAIMPTIVFNGEAKIAKDLALEDNIGLYQTWYTTTTSGSRYVEKSSSWDDIEWVSLIASDAHYLLEKREESWLLDYFPAGTSYGVPKFWGDWDNSYMVLAPVPAEAYTLHVKASAKLGGLSPVNPSTWLSLNFPEVLLYACLVGSEVFHKSPDLLKMYTQEYEKQLGGLIATLRSQKFDALKYTRGSSA